MCGYEVHLLIISCKLSGESTIRTVASAYMTETIFIFVFQLTYKNSNQCHSISLRYIRNHRGDNISPWRTPTRILNASVNIPILYADYIIYIKWLDIIHNIFPCKPYICRSFKVHIRVHVYTSVYTFRNPIIITY